MVGQAHHRGWPLCVTGMEAAAWHWPGWGELHVLSDQMAMNGGQVAEAAGFAIVLVGVFNPLRVQSAVSYTCLATFIAIFRCMWPMICM